MSTFRRFISSYWKEIILVKSIVFVYFLSRLISIKQIPIFLDEAIYVHWAQQGFYDAQARLLSLVDGKQPGFVWLTTLFMHWIGSPLAAGRLVSVCAGVGTMIGLFFLTKKLFHSRWVALLATASYVLYPFATVMDRMALYEGLVGMLLIWGMCLEIYMVQTLQSSWAFLLALCIGFGLLTKSSTQFLIYLLPVSLVVVSDYTSFFHKKFLRWVYLAGVAIALGYVYSSVLFLSPNQKMIAEKNLIFLYPVTHVLQGDRLPVFFANLKEFGSWIGIYLTIPMILMLGITLFIHDVKKERVFLLAWFLIPFLGISLFGRQVYPRYMFPMTLPLLPLVALGAYTAYIRLRHRFVRGLAVVLVILVLFSINTKILFDFSHAPIPKLDLYQYVNGWPAGGGIKEVVRYLTQEAQDKKIAVFSEGVYGSLPTTSMELYFKNHELVYKNGIYPLTDELPEEIYTQAVRVPTYFILNQQQTPPPWPMKLVAQYQKGVGTDYLRLYTFVLEEE